MITHHSLAKVIQGELAALCARPSYRLGTAGSGAILGELQILLRADDTRYEELKSSAQVGRSRHSAPRQPKFAIS